MILLAVFRDPRLLPPLSGDAAGGDDVLALGRSATCLENEHAVLLATGGSITYACNTRVHARPGSPRVLHV